jgi:hypothetical protein
VVDLIKNISSSCHHELQVDTIQYSTVGEGLREHENDDNYKLVGNILTVWLFIYMFKIHNFYLKLSHATCLHLQLTQRR